MIPSWLSRYANENDLREVEAAVARAEGATAGEIVPMIVRRSAPVSHVSLIVGLLCFSFFMTLLPFAVWWLPGPLWLYDILAAAFSLVFGWIAGQWSVLQRGTTSACDQERAVFQRAQLEFHETGIPSTQGRTGILIFVSLQERRAVILGDRSISERLTPETWVEVIDGLLAKMRQKKLREGFTEAIARIGGILSREFPIQPDDRNELPNKLIVKD